jgi:uncharacterized delta-60 repeat protein
VAILPDDRIVVAGSTNTGSTNGFEVAVARYTADGQPDTTFSGDGIQTTEITAGSSGESGTAVALQPDGKILVAANPDDAVNGDEFAVLRYMPNGDLDPSFDGDGVAITSLSSGNDQPNAIAVQSNGKIVEAGGSQSKAVLVRYLTDGSPDLGFGAGGIVRTDATPGADDANDMTLDPLGRIVVAGSGVPGGSGTDALFARYIGDPLPVEEPTGSNPAPTSGGTGPPPGPPPGPPAGAALKPGACANPQLGTRRADRLVGTVAGDMLRGGAGNDVLIGGRGADCLLGGTGNDRLNGGKGRDKLSGGSGNDTINSADGVRETVLCGSGKDRVVADRKDRLRGCERVTRRR